MKRLTYEEVKRYIESFNYKLLSDEYKNNKEKLSIRCENGHEYFATFSSFKSGQRCLECYNERRNECCKLSYEEVKEYFELFDYKLISENYINSLMKLLVECPQGHLYEVAYSSFKRGSRCPKCGKTYKYSWDEINKIFKEYNYTLLSEDYGNNKEKLKIKCPLGHEFEMTYSQFQQGQRCSICAREHKNEDRRLTYDYVKEYIEDKNYKWLSGRYENNKSKLKLLCPHGHHWVTNFSYFKDLNTRCPFCNMSKGERRIADYLEVNNIEYIYNKEYFENLKGINGGLLRPDFIIEDKKIWIEYDGVFHYKKVYDGDGYETLLIHDEIKNQYAKKNNWELIRIPYWEYDNIEEILNHKINKI